MTNEEYVLLDDFNVYSKQIEELIAAIVGLARNETAADWLIQGIIETAELRSETIQELKKFGYTDKASIYSKAFLIDQVEV